MSTLPLVREYMDKVVPTLRPETDIYEAVSFLLDNHVTGAPVVDGQDGVIGMLTEYDCLRLLAEGVDSDIPRGRVKDFMSTKVQTIPSRMNIYFAAGIFVGNRFRRLPVVDDGKLVGAITRFDILRAIKKAMPL